MGKICGPMDRNTMDDQKPLLADMVKCRRYRPLIYQLDRWNPFMSWRDTPLFCFQAAYPITSSIRVIVDKEVRYRHWGTAHALQGTRRNTVKLILCPCSKFKTVFTLYFCVTGECSYPLRHEPLNEGEGSTPQIQPAPGHNIALLIQNVARPYTSASRHAQPFFAHVHCSYRFFLTVNRA